MYIHVHIYNGVLINCFCMNSCLPTNCDNVVSCIKTLSLCRVPCVSVPPILSYINLNIPIVLSNGLKCGVLLFTNCGVLWSKKKLWGCFYVGFIAVPSCMCQFC